ncbi:LysR family transcriptional regulator [Domibacillus epiphyticus]|uniref:LysR family transcriptional regulator n=1 Tax=Domibacillus epiphyticus TaxID=1714355 RepID=A0A1V2ABI9_9BACI|nr:LysR family transcriptional regulator [Domibacillus epiphyticus]OMP68363.1 LysR family transcriptional regulator [Domibacillus epiphyticus]
MDEKDWSILVTLYEERNITKAAHRLYISQPALTYRIQQLEKEFDTKIVSRGKKGVEFTVKGDYLVQYAKEMQMQLRKTKEHLLNMDNTVKGALRLGASGMFARYELPTLLKDFLSQYPDVEINLKTGWSADISQMLQKEEAHVGIIRGDYHWHDKKVLFHSEKICLASSTKVDFKDLPSLPRINYKTDQSLQHVIEQWWQETYTVPPLISMEVDRIDTCKQLVLNGLGYAILPEICVKKEDPLQMIPIVLPDHQYLLRNTWIFYRDVTLELVHVKAFINFLQQSKMKST